MEATTRNEPARCYRITVRGRLSEGVVGSAFDGMRIEPGVGQTSLVGPVLDQSHLFGVLDRLRDFGLELVGVEEVIAP
jgi:hypothetical protein